MTNFTKEELESLRASIIATQINHSGFYGDKRVYENATKLCDKIEALIDNYRESTSVGNVGSNSVVITGDSLKHLASSKSVAIGYGAKVSTPCSESIRKYHELED